MDVGRSAFSLNRTAPFHRPLGCVTACAPSLGALYLGEIGIIPARFELPPSCAGCLAARVALLPARGGILPAHVAMIQNSERSLSTARWKRPNARWKHSNAAFEAFQRLRIPGPFFRQELQSNATVKFRVLCRIDHAHTAAAKFVEDSIMRDGGPRHLWLSCVLSGTLRLAQNTLRCARFPCGAAGF